MTRVVRTQAELDAALKAGVDCELAGNGVFAVSGSATVRAYDSATVRAYDSATVTAYGSATVTAYGSATVRAYDSATVTASGSATVTASDSATVTASGFVAVQRLSSRCTIDGGVVITPPDLTNPTGWLDYYGIKVTRGTAMLYKGLDDDFKSGWGFHYPPGAKVTAPDWEPTNTCGGGLHLSPRAHMALAYGNHARFVAVKVRVTDLIPIGDAHQSDKCKVKACTVLYECDQDGEQITPAASAGAA